MPRGGLWPGLALLAAFLLGQGREVQDLPSFFPSWEGQGAMGGVSGILLETVGEGVSAPGPGINKAQGRCYRYAK